MSMEIARAVAHLEIRVQELERLMMDSLEPIQEQLSDEKVDEELKEG